PLKDCTCLGCDTDRERHRLLDCHRRICGRGKGRSVCTRPHRCTASRLSLPDSSRFPLTDRTCPGYDTDREPRRLPDYHRCTLLPVKYRSAYTRGRRCTDSLSLLDDLPIFPLKDCTCLGCDTDRERHRLLDCHRR